ncbi:MAG: prepilin peptidase [Bdellovibrionota bacterium]|nr:prepilin peptidase [Bdellovibrionota bacterium]
MVGSFLNVLILRMPKGENFVSERSHCPKCNKLIYWYENIPIISYLFLRGKCSGCKNKISIQYPAVELFTGVVCLALAPSFISVEKLASFLFYFSVACAFIVHFIIDLKHKILPDGINIYLAILFIASSALSRPYEFWLIGGLVGFLFPLAITYIFYLLKNQVGLGGGDIKLYGALGIFLGPMGVLHNIFMSCMLGSLISIPLLSFKIIDRKTPVPFGPFIILAAIIQIYFPSFYQSIVEYISGPGL